MLPATPADAKGLLKSAIRSDDPVVFIEHEILYGDKGEVPDGEHLVPIGKAEIKRPGADVTPDHLLAVAQGHAWPPPSSWPSEGIDAEVIDLRTIRPLDLDTLLASVVKTHRAVIVEEDWPYCGLGAGIADRIMQRRLRRARRPDPPRRPPRTRRSPTTGRSKPRCCRASIGSWPQVHDVLYR